MYKVHIVVHRIIILKIITIMKFFINAIIVLFVFGYCKCQVRYCKCLMVKTLPREPKIVDSSPCQIIFFLDNIHLSFSDRDINMQILPRPRIGYIDHSFLSLLWEVSTPCPRNPDKFPSFWIWIVLSASEVSCEQMVKQIISVNWKRWHCTLLDSEQHQHQQQKHVRLFKYA